MLEKLTKKHIEHQEVVRDRWINISLHEKSYDEEEIVAGVKWMYYISNLKEPKVVIVKGPKDFSKKFRDSVRDSVRASVWDSVRASVGYTNLVYDSDDASFYEYFKEIKAIQPIENADKYYGYLKTGIFYTFFFEKVAYVMIRPTLVKQDEQKRLHSVDGPALAFEDGTEIYKLNGVTFEKKWWNKIVNDKFTAEEVFAIDNLEHRRIAYEFMDKAKMKKLKDYNILDEVKDDGYGYPMKIISFNVKGVNDPLKYLNCFCPSTGREYFIGTDEENCNQAKSKSFGFDNKDIKFIKEW